MQVQPYLFFDGRCEEAVEFYRHAVGAEVELLMRYKDSDGVIDEYRLGVDSLGLRPTLVVEFSVRRTT